MESLVDQSLADFEIIVVEDGSTDGTVELLQHWVSREPRVRILEKEHEGIIAALNAGLAICRSPFVARMDSDDRCSRERLELQAGYLKEHPEIDVVSCRVKGFPSEQVREGFQVYLDWLNGLLTDVDIRREIFVESPLPHPSVMFRREAILFLGGYQDNGWAEDYDLWLRLYLSGGHFARLPEALLEWRERPERLTRTDSRYSLENFLRAKAHYLSRSLLVGRDALFIWGSGMMGRRLGRQLERAGCPLTAFVDIDPRKVGRTRRGRPIISPADLQSLWSNFKNPMILTAVGARGAREIIRSRLERLGFVEGKDWWHAA